MILALSATVAVLCVELTETAILSAGIILRVAAWRLAGVRFVWSKRYCITL